MQGDAKVLDYLNAQLKNELTAINQYFLHYRMLKHWGFERMAKHEYDESIEEMKHADQLIERILMLEGLPNLQDLGKLLDRRERDRGPGLRPEAERASQVVLKDAIAHCESVRDYVSRELLDDILDGHRGAHRPPGDAARAGRQGRRTELPAVADGRGVLRAFSEILDGHQGFQLRSIRIPYYTGAVSFDRAP